MSTLRGLKVSEVIQALKDLGGEANWPDINRRATEKRGGGFEPYLNKLNYDTTMFQLIQQHCHGYAKYVGPPYFEKIRRGRFRLINQAYDFLNGDKLYQQRARDVFPILIRQAKAMKTIHYSALAEEVSIPNPRNLNYPLGFIGDALKKLSKEWDVKIPQIQCIVINKDSGLPGEGIGSSIDQSDFKKLKKKQQKQIVNRVLTEVFGFDRWHEVLADLGLKPVQNKESITNTIKKTKASGGSGESELHKKLKNKIADNPELIGLNGKQYRSDIEYAFPSADTIDILFTSSEEWVGVEVKSKISADEDILRGLYQCVKYQALMEAHLSVLDENKDAKTILALGGKFPPELIPVKNILGVETVEKIGA